jgi:Meiotically up-regulated gene 113
MIYFVREGLTGPIKIGFSGSTRQRVNSLRSASPNVLTCLAVMRGTRIDEYKLHQQFSDARVQGEWFTATPALLKYISVNAREQFFGGFMSKYVQLSFADIQRFKRFYPCSGIPDLDSITFGFAANGDLYDIQAVLDGAPVDSETFDGAGLLALSQDAQNGLLGEVL